MIMKSTFYKQTEEYFQLLIRYPNNMHTKYSNIH